MHVESQVIVSSWSIVMKDIIYTMFVFIFSLSNFMTLKCECLGCLARAWNCTIFA